MGAAAGFAAERVVAGRPLRRDTSTRRLGLGQLRGPHQLVKAADGVQLYVEIDDARPDARWGDLTVIFIHGYALNLDSFHFQRLALRGNARLASMTSVPMADPAEGRRTGQRFLSSLTTSSA